MFLCKLINSACLKWGISVLLSPVKYVWFNTMTLNTAVQMGIGNF